MNTDLTTQLSNTFNEGINRIVAFIPEFLAGLIILLVGWLVASAIRALVSRGLHAANAERWLGEAGIRDKNQQNSWINTFAQIIFWAIIIVFLIPAMEAWNLPGVNLVIGQLVGYLPNVIAAVIVGFIGFIFAKLAYQTITAAAGRYGTEMASLLGNVARYAILIFTGLIVLSQLGIAERLVDIFFGALMFALALGLGLSFGLGGREHAGQLIKQIADKFRSATRE
jgi:hypothetical protein